MRHDDREREVLAKSWHKIWKYASIASAVIATANLFLATGAIVWHANAEREHQKEIDDWDRAEMEVAGEHPSDPIAALHEVMDDADEDSNMFVDPYKVWEKH